MEKEELSGISSWIAPFIQTTEDVIQAVASATPVQSPRPSVVYSSKEESNSQLERIQQHVSRILKGLYSPSEIKRGLCNPEILTSQKRQWADFQMQSLDHRVWKEPSKLFESMVVVGLPPNTDIRSLHDVYFSKKSEVSGRSITPIGGLYQSRDGPCLEPQVLFVYPPEKQLPPNLISFCFPAGVEVNSIERTPSMSEINEILLGQEHLKQSDHSFVFRLQAADNSTLYGCCILVKEIIQKPSGLISMISDGPPRSSALSRCVLTTKRCYCIISRVPFVELHFGVLNSILTEERLNRLTKQMSVLDLESLAAFDIDEMLNDRAGSLSQEDTTYNMQDELAETPKLGTCISISGELAIDKSPIEYESSKENGYSKSECYEPENLVFCGEPTFDSSVSDHFTHQEPAEKRLPNAVLPFLRYQRYESSESSSSFQDSPCEDRHFRSDADEEEIEVASSSGQDNLSEYDDVLAWAKANNHGSLQIICKYYQLPFPSRGSTIKFDPLDHLQPLEYRRPRETFLTLAGSAFDFNSCNTRLELVEAQSALVAQEEATALSVWTISCLCGSLRLDHVLTLFAAALLEKHIVVVCPNLGILSALVLSIIPLIRPYQWQSLLMPVLPDDMVEFLDAPVPYIVGVKNKTTDVQSKLSNAVVVDASKNRVKSTTIPQLPQHRELYSRLSPFHAKLVGESYLGKRRPVYECTDVQVEAAHGFLRVLRSYLDSLCSNIRSHTITDVQSNDDKVSLLLKESFIESFPSRDRPFMKLFLDTQLFSVHTDFVLSFFQKD